MSNTPDKPFTVIQQGDTLKIIERDGNGSIVVYSISYNGKFTGAVTLNTSVVADAPLPQLATSLRLPMASCACGDGTPIAISLDNPARYKFTSVAAACGPIKTQADAPVKQTQGLE